MQLLKERKLIIKTCEKILLPNNLTIYSHIYLVLVTTDVPVSVAC